MIGALADSEMTTETLGSFHSMNQMDTGHGGIKWTLVTAESNVPGHKNEWWEVQYSDVLFKGILVVQDRDDDDIHEHIGGFQWMLSSPIYRTITTRQPGQSSH
uniref:Uncharacterized protein n=1 Tax=Nymphaea colorata TaxID=210225 RepID=A0A5K0V9Q1_9MAGN